MKFDFETLGNDSELTRLPPIIDLVMAGGGQWHGWLQKKC